MRGVRITGNQIRCAWDTGIYLHCADRATVSENRIRTLYPGSSSETRGIRLSRSRSAVTVSGNWSVGLSPLLRR